MRHPPFRKCIEAEEGHSVCINGDEGGDDGDEVHPEAGLHHVARGHGGGPKDNGVGGGGDRQHEGVGRGHGRGHDQVQGVLTNGQRQVGQDGQEDVGCGGVGGHLENSQIFLDIFDSMSLRSGKMN